MLWLCLSGLRLVEKLKMCIPSYYARVLHILIDSSGFRFDLVFGLFSSSSFLLCLGLALREKGSMSCTSDRSVCRGIRNVGGAEKNMVYVNSNAKPDCMFIYTG
jgi:hypothetical protein